MTEARQPTPVVPLVRPQLAQPTEERVAALEPLVALHGQRLDAHDQRFREEDRARHGIASDLGDVKQRQEQLEGVNKSLDERLSRLEQAMTSLTLIARHLKSWYAAGTIAAVVGAALLNRVAAPAVLPSAAQNQPAAVVSGE